jgi:hypothetical protein
MAPEDDGSHIEIRDEHGDLTEPPPGVSYSGTYTPIESGTPAFNPSGAHSCVFCRDSDWQWILKIRPTAPGDDLAWAPYLVACATCHRLLRSGQLAELRQRISQSWLLEMLDQLLERIIAFTPRR